jgi:hypothetical protein
LRLAAIKKGAVLTERAFFVWLLISCQGP